jgi:hypothetical protein
MVNSASRQGSKRANHVQGHFVRAFSKAAEIFFPETAIILTGCPDFSFLHPFLEIMDTVPNHEIPAAPVDLSDSE